MPESGSDQRVTVTAQERIHPALRRIARACIALARQLLELPPSSSAGPREAARLDQQEPADD